MTWGFQAVTMKMAVFWVVAPLVNSYQSTRRYNPQDSQLQGNILSPSQSYHLLYSTEVHYLIHNNPPLKPILSQTNTVHFIMLYFLRFVLILLVNLHHVSKWSFSQLFWLKYCMHFISSKHAACSTQLISFEVINLKMFHELYRLRSSSLFNFFPSLVTSCLIEPNNLH
jgi:hypothetical protein